jgi:ATP-binding cassette subfamily B protein
MRGGPSLPVEKSKHFWPSAKRLIATLRPEWLKSSIAILVAITGTIFAVIGPRLLGEATNLVSAGFVSAQYPATVTKEQIIAQLRAEGDDQRADMLSAMPLTPGQGIDFSALASILLLTLVLYIVSALFLWLTGYILNGVVQRTMFALREEIEAKIHDLPLSYFDKEQRGELLSKVTNDVDNISQSLQQTLSQAITSLLTVVGVVAMMVLLSPILALVALVTIPLTLIVTSVIAKRSQKLFVQQWGSTGELNGQIEETFSGHALVKVFGRQHEIEKTFHAKNHELFRSSFGAQFVSGLVMPAMNFIGNLVFVGIAVVGGLQVAAGMLQIGDVQAFIQYSRQFTQPLAQLGSMVNIFQSGVASAERVFALLDAPEQHPDPKNPKTPTTNTGRLVFADVDFSYAEDKPLIENLNFSAEPGQTVAIVGPTGAGKTTLVNLIMRFYELNGGAITLDGVDISSMTRDDLRSRMGMVLQDTWLFGGTIRDNIAYARPDATEAEIVEAARASYVDRFVHSLPEGYDTVLNDDATNISAGEKQLMTIARAFLANPSILILDEATSSVDTRTELLLQKAMGAIRSDRTSFVIAHRLSTIRDADLILVMDAGAIVEQGTHAELIERDGAYASLYNAQFAAPTDSSETVSTSS